MQYDDLIKLLMNYLIKWKLAMKENNIYVHSEGSFTPYDPDNRRGILSK